MKRLKTKFAELQLKVLHIWTSQVLLHTLVRKKKFFGHETDKYLMITRIRGPVEKYLPKLIVKFDKEQDFTKYKIRFSLLATVLITLFTLMAISFLIELIKCKQFNGEIIIPLILLALLILFTLLEIKITQKIIDKTLTKESKLE